MHNRCTNVCVILKTFDFLDRTRIVRGPSDLSVNEGTRVDLRCEAVADSSLELHYTWKRDDATIEYNLRVHWLKDQNVLTIANLTVEDAGIYTCVAYTPQPKYSEAKASAIVNISGRVKLKLGNKASFYMVKHLMFGRRFLG